MIIRARPNLSPHKKTLGSIEDPDLPECMNWTEKQVGDWITSIGWPQLRETFVRNMITGRRLVLIDCTALNKMGMTDLASMREVAGKIRGLLGTPAPNGLRPIMRVAPFERFLRRKVYNGRSYDDMTFEKFCEVEGFNYELLIGNKNAQIPCTCEVTVTTPEQAEADEDGEGDEDDEEHSLRNAPTVEFLVRNALIRNKKIDEIMQDILDNVFLPTRERKYGKEVWGSLKRGIGEGYDDLNLYYPNDKLEFASSVAHHLIDELYKTVEVLNDISQLEKHIKVDVTTDEMKMFQDAATVLMEQAAPIASLLALGELDLENIFSKEPCFENYVDDLIREAEKTTNALVPEASEFVDDVIAEAWRKIPDMNLKELDSDLRRSILRMANHILHGISDDVDDIVEAVTGKASAVATRGGKRNELGSPSSPKTMGGGGRGKDLKTAVPARGAQQQQQQQQKQKPGQVIGTPSSVKPSGRASAAPASMAASAAQGSKLQVSASTRKSGARPSTATAPAAPRSAGSASETGREAGEGGGTDVGDKTSDSGQVNDAGQQEMKAVAGPAPGTGNSGSSSENKDGAQEKGKGKKDDKQDEDKPGVEGAGEGKSGTSVVVHTAAVELAIPPPTPVLGRISTGERRDSPLLRSPMTVTTPGSPVSAPPGTADAEMGSPIPKSPMLLGALGKAGNRTHSFADSEAGDVKIPMEQKPPISANEVAIIRMEQRPKDTNSKHVSSQHVKPKVLRMSKDQDRILQPLIDAAHSEVHSELKVPEGHPPPEGVSPRQGRKQPPSQQTYNQQQQVLRRQQELMHQVKPDAPRVAYHQRKGIIVKGEKDPTARKFGSITEPEDNMPPIHNQLAANIHKEPSHPAPKAVKASTFVLIPKSLKETQHELVRTKGQTVIVPVQQQVVPATAPPSQEQAQQKFTQSLKMATTPKDEDIAEKERKASQPAGAQRSEESRKGKRISESAQQIWEQMKEQYEARKSFEQVQKRKSKVGEDEAEKAKEGNERAEKEKVEKELQRMKKKTLMVSHQADVIVDQQHVQEMKEHRQTMVENWAKKHSSLEDENTGSDSHADERLRLVRMTADKVVTEICTMALTHMLLQAEAGKNASRIMNALKRIKRGEVVL